MNLEKKINLSLKKVYENKKYIKFRRDIRETEDMKIMKKINKAGYKATIYQNPASKHFKVWVQGGASKSSAEKVAQAMQKIGYKGSFAFPPAK